MQFAQPSQHVVVYTWRLDFHEMILKWDYRRKRLQEASSDMILHLYPPWCHQRLCHHVLSCCHGRCFRLGGCRQVNSHSDRFVRYSGSLWCHDGHITRGAGHVERGNDFDICRGALRGTWCSRFSSHWRSSRCSLCHFYKTSKI